MIEEIIKISRGQTAEIGEINLLAKTEVDKGMNKITGEKISEVT